MQGMNQTPFNTASVLTHHRPSPAHICRLNKRISGSHEMCANGCEKSSCSQDPFGQNEVFSHDDKTTESAAS